MTHLLNLLAAVALLVWGTYLVRTGILRVFGANLRQALARSIGSRPAAALAGLGVTALVQSSTATALIVSSFVGQGLVALPTALAVMLGADVGTSLMSVVFSLDLSWLSPLLILVGVVLFITRQDTAPGRFGRVLIGLGLMLLALRLVSESTAFMVRSPVARELLQSLSSDILLEITVGAVMSVAAYSSLAIVLLTATLAASGTIPLDVALGLVLGANLGGGLLGVLATAKSPVDVRHVPIGNLVFKLAGVLVAAPFVGLCLRSLQPWLPEPASVVVLYHLALNVLIALGFLAFTHIVSGWVERWLPRPDGGMAAGRPQHLDPSALATPSLAISNAAREALHQADVVETMVLGMMRVIKDNDLRTAEELRRMDDTVDQLCSAIKYYLTKISREALDEEESRRWTDIISFTINMEQIGDITERILQDIEDKKIRKARSFSQAGMAEICELHARLVENLHLGMSVFLHGSAHDARRLLEEKERFRNLERAYAGNHLTRLSENTVQSIETSSLHLDLISDMKRINSHICSVAYPVLRSQAQSPDRVHRAAFEAPPAPQLPV
jgi:phosphate:Na+ symporter